MANISREEREKRKAAALAAGQPEPETPEDGEDDIPYGTPPSSEDIPPCPPMTPEQGDKTPAVVEWRAKYQPK